MRKLAAQFTSIRFSRVIVVSAVLYCIFSLVLWDKSRLDREFSETMNLLRQTRFTAIVENRVLITKFRNKNIIVSDGKTGHILNNYRISTLANVNYDTTLGKDMIVFSGRGTNAHNIRIHGGDLTLRSWLGFKRSIHVNCTGLAREGRYPSD